MIHKNLKFYISLGLMNMSKNIDMTQGPFLKKAILFAFPIFLNSLLQTSYSTADSLVVGRFEGHKALAAVSSNGPLWFFLVSLFITLTTSAGVLISRAIGAKNTKIISNAVHTAITMSLAFGVVIMFVGLTMARTFLVWMSVPDDILDLSTTYLRIIFLGCPVNIFYNTASAIFRSKGNSKTPLMIQSISGLINVVLNLVFVAVFKWSVAGVAISTVVSQYVSAAWFFILLIKSNDECKLNIKKLKIHKSELLEILHIGIPSGITSSISNFAAITTQTILNSFGAAVLAGCSASTTLLNYSHSFTGALTSAASVMTSQNYGAKNKENIKKAVLTCAVLNGSINLIYSIVSIIFRYEFIGLFTTDAASIEAGAYRTLFELPVLFITAISGVLSNAMVGMRKSVLTMIFGLTTIGIRLIWNLLIFPLNPQIYFIYILSLIITPIMFVVYFIAYKHTLKTLEF